MYPGYVSHRNHIAVTLDGILTINEVGIDDEGTYSCTGVTAAESKESKIYLKVINESNIF